MIEIPEPIGKYDRFYYLIEYLSTHKTGVTVDEIAKAVMKSTKTVRRDLTAMDTGILDIDVIKERGPDRKYKYRVEKHATIFRPLLLSTYEVLALYFIRGFAHFKDNPFINHHLGKVFDKIDISVEKNDKGFGNEFFNRVSKLFILPRELGGKVYSRTNELNILEIIIEAAINYQICEIKYVKKNKENIYRIAPLHFFNYRDAIYILSMNLNETDEDGQHKIITLALHRVRSVDLVKSGNFEYPYDFNLEYYLRFGLFNFEGEQCRVKLKFSPEISDYILDREWYPNQKNEIAKDGSVIISFASEINLILLGWIRGFGSRVEVLEPPELRKEVVDDLKQNLKVYRKMKN